RNGDGDLLEVRGGRVGRDDDAVDEHVDGRIRRGGDTAAAYPQIHRPRHASIEPREPHHRVFPRPRERAAGRLVALRAVDAGDVAGEVAIELDGEGGMLGV